MTIDAQKALQLQSDFLSGVGANFEDAKGRHFRGTIWERVSDDDVLALKTIMAQKRQYDRASLEKLPSNRRVTIRGYEKRFGLFKRRTGVAVASVLTPMEHFVEPEGDAPPIGLGELTAHVRRLVTDGRTPHIIGVCSPTGFTQEALRARPDQSNVTLVLIEPESRGGWKVHGASDSLDPRLMKIFDPEGPKQKVERVRRLIDDSSVDLLTGGLSVSAVASRSNLPEDVVRQSFETLATHDPELRVTREDSELILFRGASVSSPEKKLGMIDRIRQLFAGEGDETSKINALAERRAQLVRQRDKVDAEIQALEQREATLIEEVRAAGNERAQHRALNRVKRLRREIDRRCALATMLDKPIDTISTDIHNLTLIREGSATHMPDIEQLTEHAVQAEEILESINTGAEMSESLDVGVEPRKISQEDKELLDEILGRSGAEASRQSSVGERRKRHETQRPAESADHVEVEEPESSEESEPPSRRPNRDAEAT